MGNLFLDIPVPVVNGAGAKVDVSAMAATKTIIVGGAFNGAVTIEFSTDDLGTSWAPVPSGTFNNGGGSVTTQLAARWMRAVMDGYKNGSANADVGGPGDLGGTKFVELGPVQVDISTLASFKTVVSSGQVNIEVSEDGTSWAELFSIPNKGSASGTFIGKFARTSGPTVWMGAADLDVDDDGEAQPPFATVTLTIYARLTGDDTTGSGSLAKPYRTFQRAMRDVPSIVPAGTGYVVDITDIGVETLPANYQIQSIMGTFDISISSPVPFLFNHVLTIRAFPKLLGLPGTEARITVADAPVISADATNNLLKVTVPGVRPSWAAGALKGRHFIRTIGAAAATCCIYDSDDDDGGGNAVVFLCNQAIGPALVAGEEYQIVEPSATLEAPSSPDNDAGAVRALNVSSIGFQGIRVRCTVPGADTGLAIGTATRAFTELGDFPDGLSVNGTDFGAQPFSSTVRRVLVTGESFNTRRSYFAAVTNWILVGTDHDFLNVVLDACAPLTNFNVHGVNGGSGPLPTSFFMVNGLVRGSTGAAGVHQRGGQWLFRNVKVESCAGDAFIVERGNNYLTLDKVGGAGNVGVGIRAQDGAQVQIAGVAVNTTVTGGAGDLKSGDLAIVAYAALPQFDITYDPTLGAPAQVTGTGTKIFART